MQTITSVGGELWIDNNNLLQDLSSLENIQSIGENTLSGSSLFIINNDVLQSIMGLESIAPASILDLNIYNNPQLSECAVSSICDYLIDPNGTVDIHDNATGCDSMQQVIDSCETLSCLPEGITFTTQEEIDSFQLNYPGCDVIEGDVVISGEDITNLNGLNILSSIGGSLLILYNNELTSLGGLDNLATINVSLYITGNNLLSDISSLQNLTHIGEDIVIGSLYQPAMPPPIGGNPLLTNLEGLNGISSIGGMLYIRANGGLTSLSGLENLASTGGSIVVGDNDSLPNFEGLKSLTTIGGSLGVYDNELLVSLSGLDSLSMIAGHLAIGSYEYFLGDGDNPALANLAGLEKLKAVGGVFEIINNSTIFTLMNLQSIEPGSIDSISIKDNPLLSECHAEAICAYLQSDDPVVEISGNANGCFSPENVVDVCNGVSVAEHKGEKVMSIFPNPCSGTANLRYSIHNGGYAICELFTISGMKIMELMSEEKMHGTYEVEIDLRDLPAGIYYCVLKTNDGTYTTKMIKL